MSVVKILVNDYGFLFEQAEFIVLKYAKTIKALLYDHGLTQAEVAASLAQSYAKSKTLEQ